MKREKILQYIENIDYELKRLQAKNFRAEKITDKARRFTIKRNIAVKMLDLIMDKENLERQLAV